MKKENKRMTKRIILFLAIIVLLVLLVPIPKKYKDGGSVDYNALLYQIRVYHRLDLECKDGFRDGLEIKILGNTVYQKIEEKDVNNTKNNDVRIIKVHGTLYYDTGKESTIIGRCGVMDGKITSHVPLAAIPTKNNESNFEGDHEYQIIDNNTIEVLIENKWQVFKNKKEDKGILNVEELLLNLADTTSAYQDFLLTNYIDVDLSQIEEIYAKKNDENFYLLLKTNNTEIIRKIKFSLLNETYQFYDFNNGYYLFNKNENPLLITEINGTITKVEPNQITIQTGNETYDVSHNFSVALEERQAVRILYNKKEKIDNSYQIKPFFIEILEEQS